MGVKGNQRSSTANWLSPGDEDKQTKVEAPRNPSVRMQYEEGDLIDFRVPTVSQRGDNQDPSGRQVKRDDTFLNPTKAATDVEILIDFA